MATQANGYSTTTRSSVVEWKGKQFITTTTHTSTCGSCASGNARNCKALYNDNAGNIGVHFSEVATFIFKKGPSKDVIYQMEVIHNTTKESILSQYIRFVWNDVKNNYDIVDNYLNADSSVYNTVMINFTTTTSDCIHNNDIISPAVIRTFNISLSIFMTIPKRF